AVMLLRVRRPDVPRGFRTPAVWFVAPLGIAFSLLLIWGLPLVTWERFALWMGIGMLVYFGYGIRHSKLAVQR
ncbi:MAG: amino acid permease C-terminal domain-containing protein, partial [Dokdonella sp.]|uniref:amino acid permease C-terminal domain-containing protein n=1 Tax=Dokdonella sp. TaxID=2291710 RepID=UPI00326573DB